MLLWIDTAKRASAGYITAGDPIFWLRKAGPEGQTARPDFGKIDRQPARTGGANRIMTMDVHADQIQGFFQISG